MPEKARDSFHSRTSSGERPPSYHREASPHGLPPDLSLRLQNLQLESDYAEPNKPPIPDQLIAHLKFLEAVFKLRETIGAKDKLFGIVSPPGDNQEQQSKVLEKRWAVYVTRAVDRFQAWYMRNAPQSCNGKPTSHMTCTNLISHRETDPTPALENGRRLTKEQTPPLDVLMVWHAYLLNPRNFLEDQFRFGKMDFWAAGFPWDIVDAAINPHTFEFTPTLLAVGTFESTTGRYWDNLNDPPTRSTLCPKCNFSNQIPYTINSGHLHDANTFNGGNGYADTDLSHRCMGCNFFITHEALRVGKFKFDVQQLMDRDMPLPGTLFSPRTGQPNKKKVVKKTLPAWAFPNQLIKHGELSVPILNGTTRLETVEDMRAMFEVAIKDKSLVRKAKSKLSGNLLGFEKFSIRRLMSRYWHNSSMFALDLVGAVIRQGTFIEKMHRLDWLNSPALLNTMNRCTIRYHRFFEIMKIWTRSVAVPTLDIDLAWHTHQLMPTRYYQYSDAMTGKLIDHDDKIEESKLSDQFAWTTKIYQSKYNEPYSECTCWYCEAIRETTTSSFGFGSNASARKQVHSVEISSNPLNSPHISAHNAVRDESKEAKAKRLTTEAKIDKAYHQAVARAAKKGRTPPTRDSFYFGYCGYLMNLPWSGYYLPYGVDPCITDGSGTYNADPCHVDTSSGAAGACANGTCGGMAAAGGAACVGSGGGCGGGAAGCGGGSGGGGCGGGGGGGGGGCGGGGGGGG